MMGINSAYQSATGRIPNWVGFGLIIAAGITAIVIGAIVPMVAAVAFGVAAIAAAIVAWVDGARSSPDVDPFKPSWGGTVKRVGMAAWLIIFGLFAVAALIAVVVG
jgi:hypothetical protein